MKIVKVVAAVIRDGEYFFATARGYGDYRGQWEFPGGKVEEGELARDALKREILEELDTKIEVEEFIQTVEYDYPTFHLSMDCFFCSVLEGTFELKEAQEARWLKRDEFDDVTWLPADKVLVETLRS